MAFEPRPTFNAWNRQQQIGLALDTPFTFSQALAENFQQGILDSFGLGTVARGAIAGDPRQTTGPEGLGNAVRGVGELLGTMQPDQSKPLSKTEYESSPWFRDSIQWDEAFTEDRAASLAAMSDKKAVRAKFSERQPVAAFLGQLGGQALDPVNYVPVFGAGVAASAVARFGSVAGRALISASEAAINTAAFGVLTSGIRAKYGDDTSWQSIATEVAMSAVIGGAFGGGIGLLARGVDRRAAAVANARPKLETIGNVMESRAVLNDAVTGLIDRAEVELVPNSLQAIERMSDEVVARTSGIRALRDETAKVTGSNAGEVVISPSGARVSVRPEVVEARSLIRASGDLQVRDRSSPQSRQQVEDIAINLDPARLMPNVDASQGAPLVGADGVIDSGNGRVMALTRAYEAYPEKAQAYRQALVDAGYADAAGMQEPVLINRRLTELTPEARAQFNAEVNGPTTARMTAVELAAMDRGAVTDGVLDVLDEAPITAASNRAAVGRFLANLPANERGALVDASGSLSADGARRVENALVAAAYGDADTGVLRRFAEATDDNTRSIVGALSDVAGQWARMRRDIKAGSISPDFDMTPELTQAVRLLGRWREDAAREGRPVSQVIREGLAQLDLLDGEVSPEAQTFIRMFYANDHFAKAVGREVLAARLQRVIDATNELGRPSLFGDALMPSKGEVLTNAQREQADIFTADGLEPRPEAQRGSGEGEPAGGTGGADRSGVEGGDPLAGRTIAGVMADRFTAAGRPADEAAAAAELVDSFFTTMATRLGTTSDALVAKYGLPDVARGGEIEPNAMMQGGVDSPEFNAWFGDSKVVDAEGKPLVVYHGTPNQFDAFSDKKLGKNTGADDPGIFFTSSRDVAEGFRGKRLFRKGQVLETYLSMKNPRIVDGTNIEAGSSAKWLILSQAQGDGFDGVIFKNMAETDYRGVGEQRSDVYAVFEPTQIKSTANRGTFDAGDPRILFQPAWHGTPHIFDKFEWSDTTRGKGEGAQAFGDGLYFAGNKEVAQYYRDTLSGQVAATYGGKQASLLVGRGSSVETEKVAKALGIGDELNEYGRNQVVKNAFAFVEKQLNLNRNSQPDEVITGMRDMARTASETAEQNADAAKQAGYPDRAAEEGARSETMRVMAMVYDALLTKPEFKVSTVRPGRLYKVDVPGDDDLMVWDKPLKDQPAKVKAALETLGFKEEPPPPMPSPTLIADASVRRLVQAALKQDDAAENIGLMIDNDSDLYRQGLVLAKREGLSAEDLDEGVGGVGAYIESKAQEFITALRAREKAIENAPNGARIYAKLQNDLGDAPAASQALREAGIPGHRFLDGNSRADEDGGTYNYVIYDASRVNITDFEQGGANPRGSISLDQNLIRLFETADASTALHETGHLFLGLYKRMADDPTAPEALRGEFETVKRWWSANAGDVARDANASGRAEGVTDVDVRAVLETGTSGDKAKDLAIDVGLHEQWARGFEAYLREGVAPTPGLRGIFEQFKRWLGTLYQQAIDLNVTLSDDIRAVFDRMLTLEPVDRRQAGLFGDDGPSEPMAAINGAAPAPDPVPLGLPEAEARVGRGEDMKQLAASHGVADDGSYVEQGEVDQLRDMGQLTPEDEAELAAADQLVADADAYAETLRVAANCVIN